MQHPLTARLFQNLLNFKVLLHSQIQDVQRETHLGLCLLFFLLNRGFFSHLHTLSPPWPTPPAKIPLQEMLHLTVSMFMFSRKKKSPKDSPSELATVFFPDHTSILAHMGKDFTLSLHCKSWGRGSSAFLHTFVQIYTQLPHSESILSPM